MVVLPVTTYWRNTIAHIPNNREDWRMLPYMIKPKNQAKYY